MLGATDFSLAIGDAFVLMSGCNPSDSSDGPKIAKETEQKQEFIYKHFVYSSFFDTLATRVFKGCGFSRGGYREGVISARRLAQNQCRKLV